jgi:hypothetical protein
MATTKTKVDVVIPLGTGSLKNDIELKYCLRSLEKNLINLGNVFLVGHKPDWIKGVIHIECQDSNKQNKDANIIRKVTKACQHYRLRENFIRLSDDQVLLKEMNGSAPLLRDIDMNEWLLKMQKINRWKKRFRNTAMLFKKPANFDTHTPQPYKKSEFVQLETIYPDVYKEKGGYTINSLYFNHFDYQSDKYSVVYKAEVREPLGFVKIGEKIKGKLYLSHNGDGLNEHLLSYLNTLFPDKSKFEK